MSHRASRKFWLHLDSLSPELQALARETFELLKKDPRHSSLRFKRVGAYWSVRIGRSHRALGVDMTKGVLWFWIGTHEKYKRLIRG